MPDRRGVAVGQVHGYGDLDRHRRARRRPIGRRLPTDEGYYLRATVTYTDLFGSGKIGVQAVTRATRSRTRTVSNAPPSFADQDDDSSTALRQKTSLRMLVSR